MLAVMPYWNRARARQALILTWVVELGVILDYGLAGYCCRLSALRIKRCKPRGIGMHANANVHSL